MDKSPAYVKFEEVFFTNRRGRKEVRYYLKRREGTSDLVIVGKEKKLGQHSKTTSYRYRYAIRDNSMFLSKLRSRQDVINWLSSFVTEFMWVGSAWTCSRKRKHYEAYSRRGIRISVHDFVYVLAEESRRLVAYLDDLYEDSRGYKMAVIQWFHKVDEVGLDLPDNYYYDKEIYFSLCFQDISIECIDGLATVLSPQHFGSFLKLDPPSIFHPLVCRYEVDNEVLKPFDVTQVKGYWKQSIHILLSTDAVGIRPRKRLRRLVDGDPNYNNKNLAEGSHVGGGHKHEYTIGSEVEVLSLDSGIRGMWFKAVVIKKHKDKLKVRYADIKDAVDESKDLEEWVLSSRVADDDQLGIRHSGRMMVRPSRLTNNGDACLVDVGSVVDAWLYDGWWEGIVVHNESDGIIHVYFPGEKQKSILGCNNLRHSFEWLGDQWKQMKSRPDLLASISSATETSSHDNASDLTGIIREKELEYSFVDKDLGVANNNSKEGLLTRLSWNWSTKKRRCYATNNADLLAAMETRKVNGCVMPIPPCCAPDASPIKSLVMSR